MILNGPSLNRCSELRGEVDALICLEPPELAGAIGHLHRGFREISDQEVLKCVPAAPRPYSIGTQRSPFLT